MLWLCENIVPVTVAAVSSVVAWLYGGARGDVLLPIVPWLLVLLLEVILFFPQRHRGESPFEARERCWYELRHSPLVWTTVGFLFILLIPFVNNGLCPGCDYLKIAGGLDPAPKVKFLPFCVNRLDHLSVVLSFAVALFAMIATFHCMTRAGRRLTLEMIVWNGTALALLGFVQNLFEAPGPFWDVLKDATGPTKGTFFSVFGYPNMAGDYFTLLFGLSVALWRDHCERLREEELTSGSAELAATQTRRSERFLRRHYLLIPAVFFFFAALYTLSRAAIILVTATAFVYFAHTLVVLLSRMKRARRVYVGVWSVLGFLLLAFFAKVFMPSDIRREVGTLDGNGVLDRVTGKGQYHADVAMSLWKDHPVFGCGGWGYKHLCVSKMNDMGLNVKQLQVKGGANVHNDYLQFLAEHGAVGLAAILALVVLLYYPVARQWGNIVTTLRFKKRTVGVPKPLEIFALPAPAFITTVAVLATFVHAFGDCPLRSCAILTLVFVALASIRGFLPKH